MGLRAGPFGPRWGLRFLAKFVFAKDIHKSGIDVVIDDPAIGIWPLHHRIDDDGQASVFFVGEPAPAPIKLMAKRGINRERSQGWTSFRCEA